MFREWMRTVQAREHLRRQRELRKREILLRWRPAPGVFPLSVRSCRPPMRRCCRLRHQGQRRQWRPGAYRMARWIASSRNPVKQERPWNPRRSWLMPSVRPLTFLPHRPPVPWGWRLCPPRRLPLPLCQLCQSCQASRACPSHRARRYCRQRQPAVRCRRGWRRQACVRCPAVAWRRQRGPRQARQETRAACPAPVRVSVRTSGGDFPGMLWGYRSCGDAIRSGGGPPGFGQVEERLQDAHGCLLVHHGFQRPAV